MWKPDLPVDPNINTNYLFIDLLILKNDTIYRSAKHIILHQLPEGGGVNLEIEKICFGLENFHPIFGQTIFIPPHMS